MKFLSGIILIVPLLYMINFVPMADGDSSICDVKQMVRKLKQIEIIGYELRFNIRHKKEEKLITILKGKEQSLLSHIKDSLDDFVLSGGSKYEEIDIAASGFLTILGQNGFKQTIDITEIGFFPSGTRRYGNLFYSRKLANIIKKMINISGYKDRVLITNDFFERLSGKKSNL